MCNFHNHEAQSYTRHCKDEIENTYRHTKDTSQQEPDKSKASCKVHARIQEVFFRGGPTLKGVFLVNVGYHYTWAISGRQRVDEGPTLNAGLVAL